MMKALLLTTALAVGLLYSPAPGTCAVVNVDFEQPGDATHSGSDAVLSTDGTVWNSVLFDTDASGLTDESGASTAFALAYIRNSQAPGPFVNLGASNDLQDTGVLCEGFEITGLVAGEPYTVAVYGGFNTSFSVEHAGGYSGGPCTGFGPGFSLPGTEGQDYCMLSGLQPLEISPGVYGLRVLNVSGAVLGLQLQGSTDTVEPPPADETAPSCWVSAESDGPPRSLHVSAQDTGSGLDRVTVLAAENVDVAVPPFTSGTTGEVVVELVQTDGSAPSLARLELADREGNTVSHEFEIQADPVEDPDLTPCQAVLAYFQDAVEAGTLVGNGPGRSANGRLGALRHMLEDTCELIDAGNLDEACGKLDAVHRRCDGDSGDFAAGEAAPELRSRVLELGEMYCDGNPAEGIPSGRGTSTAQSDGGYSFGLSWGVLKALYDTN